VRTNSAPMPFFLRVGSTKRIGVGAPMEITP
jgi:hypothetical protein